MSEDLKKVNIQGVPTPTQPTALKQPTLAPTSKKSKIKQLQQLKSPQINDLHMKQAKTMEASMKNPLSFNKKEEEEHFHVFKNGQRITTESIPQSYIDSNLGGKDRLESAGYTLMPVKRERLVKNPNGQWSIEEY